MSASTGRDGRRHPDRVSTAATGSFGAPAPAGTATGGTAASGPVTGGVEPLKILVADDEPAMVGVIGAILGSAGHRIIAAYDGREAMQAVRGGAPGPGSARPGDAGGRRRRRLSPDPAAGDTPIIVVSGESDLGVTVELLDAGADDYVRKPFRAAELLARTRTVVRRRRRAPARDGWIVDRSRHEVAWQGRPIPLTVTEFRLVSRLVDRLGEVVDRADLLAFAWPGVDRPDPLWLKPHMARLRSKLIAAGAPSRPDPRRRLPPRRCGARGPSPLARPIRTVTERSRAPHPSGHRTWATCNRRVADASPAQPRTRPPIRLASGWVALAPGLTIVGREDAHWSEGRMMRSRIRHGLAAAGIGTALLTILPGTVAAADGTEVNSGDTAWLLVDRPGDGHAAGAGPVLRRPGAAQERAVDDHAQLLRPGPRQRRLGRSSASAWPSGRTSTASG